MCSVLGGRYAVFTPGRVSNGTEIWDSSPRARGLWGPRFGHHSKKLIVRSIGMNGAEGE